MEFGKTLVNLPKSFRRSIRDNVKTKSKGGSGDDNLSKVTYEELVELRDNSKLIPGRKYRIIDFVTTVGEVISYYEDSEGQPHEYAKYASANHPFDIVVTALDVDKLDEVASCLLHEGDTYFSHVNISAWEIKYCLDNDTNRFEWADPDGKGVIYYMKDDRNNECDYDFKNVLFCRYCVTDNNGNVHYIGLFGGEYLPNIDKNNYTYIYTFSIRGSLDAQNNNFYDDASVVIYNEDSLDYEFRCDNNIIKNNTYVVYVDGVGHKYSFLPDITIVDISNNYNVYNNIIQNSIYVVFNAYLITSSITGYVGTSYFFKRLKGINISGTVQDTFFGMCSSGDFVDIAYINNINIKGRVSSCYMFEDNESSDNCDVTLEGYIDSTYIYFAQCVQINAIIEGCKIDYAEHTQFYGKIANTFFSYIRNSYVNATLSNVSFNTNYINSNIQGAISNLNFGNEDNKLLQLTTNLYIPNNSNNTNINFVSIPSDQDVIIAEIVGMTKTSVQFADITVSVNETLTPKLTIFVDNVNWTIKTDKV